MKLLPILLILPFISFAYTDTIYVHERNDPRYINYLDSIRRYNEYAYSFKEYHDLVMNAKTAEEIEKGYKILKKKYPSLSDAPDSSLSSWKDEPAYLKRHFHGTQVLVAERKNIPDCSCGWPFTEHVAIHAWVSKFPMPQTLVRVVPIPQPTSIQVAAKKPKPHKKPITHAIVKNSTKPIPMCNDTLKVIEWWTDTKGAKQLDSTKAFSKD